MDRRWRRATAFRSNHPKPQMKYTVEPALVEGCDCEDCRAGRHVYLLYRLPASGRNWSAMSMQMYASAEECKREHYWGLNFGPEDGGKMARPLWCRNPGPRRNRMSTAWSTWTPNPSA